MRLSVGAVLLGVTLLSCRSGDKPKSEATPAPAAQSPPATYTRAEAPPTPDPEVQQAWERLRLESPPPPMPQPPNAAPPTPVQVPTATPPPTLSSLDELKARAWTLEPQVKAIAAEADILDRNFRWYIDACYQKYTGQEWTATGRGRGSVTTGGVAVGRESFAVWGSESTLAWRESWSGASAISNETTVECRKIWSDIQRGSSLVARGLDRVQDQARVQGVLPGHLRELLAQYSLNR
jgi:hypothetical protein